MVKLLVRILDIVLYSSLFTACCATALCMATERLITSAVPAIVNDLHILVFGSTLLVYNTPRIVRKSQPSRSVARVASGWYFLFFFAGITMIAYGIIGQSRSVQLVSICLGAFAFAYFLPMLPFAQKKRLRDYGGVKIIVLAGVWTIATSILPLLYWQKNIADYPFEVLLRLTFIFTLCVIFDIRDIRADISNRINTLPNKVGLRNSYMLINVTLLLFAVLSVAQYFRHPSAGRLTGAILTALITRAVVTYLRKRPSERAYFVLADGVMVLYSLLVLCM